MSGKSDGARAAGRKPRRVLRLRWAALVVLLLTLFIGLGLFPHEPLRRFIEGRLRGALGPEVYIGRVYVAPALLRAEVWDLRIRSESLDLDLPHARLRLSPGVLVGRLEIAAIELDRPRVALRPAPATDEPAGAAPGPAAFTGPLAIALLRLNDGRFTYDGGDAGRFELDGVQIDGQVAGSIQASASGGRFTPAPPAQPLVLGPARVELRTTSTLGLDLEALHVETAASRLDVSGPLGGLAGWKPDLRFTGRVALAEVARLTGGTPLAGTVDVEGRLAGPLDALRSEATLSGERLEAAGWAVERVSVNARHDAAGEGHTRLRFDAALLGGRVRGEAALAGPRADARVTAAALDAGALARRLAPGTGDAAGTLDAAVHVRGAWGGVLAVDARATADGRHSDYDGRLAATAQGHLDLQGSRTALDWTLTTQARGSDDAAVRAADLRAAGRATGALPPVVEGRIDGRVVVPALASAAPLADDGVQPAPGTVPADVVPEGAGSAVADAAPTDTAGTVTSDVGSRAPADQARPRTADGTAAAAGARPQAAGDVAAAGPEDAADTAAAGSSAPTAAPLSAAASEPIEVQLAAHFRASAASASAHVEAQARDARLTADVATRGTRVENLTLLAEDLDLSRFVPGLAGTARAEVQAQGPTERLDGTGRAEITSAEWNGEALGDVRAGLRLEGGRPRVELSVPALRASAEGVVADGTWRGSVTLDELPLAPLGRLAEEPLDGAVAGRAELEVPFDAPARARVDAEIASVQVERAPYSVRTTRAFRVLRENGRTRITGLALRGHGAEIEADAEFGAPDEPVDLKLRASAALGELPLPEGVQAAGTVSADVRAGGTLAEPHAEGAVVTRGVSVTPPNGLAVHLDDARLDLTGDALALTSFVARAAGGALTLGGRIPWTAFYPPARQTPERPVPTEEALVTLDWDGFQVRQVLAALSPENAEALDAAFAGRAELRGTFDGLEVLRGTVVLPETQLVAGETPFTLAPATLTLEAGRLQTGGLQLTSRNSRLTLGGNVDLVRAALDLRAQGALDLRVLSGFTGEAALTGRAELDAYATGGFAAPRALGTLLLRGGTLRLRMLRQPLTEIEGWITIDGERLDVRELQARFGGGQVTGSGSARLAGLGLADVDVRLKGTDIGLAYPEGLRSRIQADLALTGKTGAMKLAGDVRAERAVYDLDTVAEQSLLGPAVAEPEPSDLLRSFALDVRVLTVNPVRVRRTSENLASLQASAQLTFRGDMETPTPFGRVDLLRDGKVQFQGREFRVESGSLVYSGDWDARIDLRAHIDRPILDKTPYGDVARDITLSATGSLEAPIMTFNAQPDGLSQGQILSLLVTGSTTGNVARGGGFVAGEQAALLLTGRLSRSLSDSLRPLGIDEIIIEPQLVAYETDPGARFTFGKRLAPKTKLVYSLSLSDPESRFIRIEGGPVRTVLGAVQRNDDGNFTYTAGQRIEFGARARAASGAPRPADDERVRIESLALEGDRPLPEPELRAELGLEPGQARTTWDVLDAGDRLREHLVEEGYLEAEVGARLDGVEAHFHVSAGPRYTWRVEGFPGAAPDLGASIRAGLFEEESVELAREELLRKLHARGHLRAEVDTHVDAQQNQRTLVFTVEPGPTLTVEDVHFPGAEALARDELLALAGGPAGILSDPEAARRKWNEAYLERHYLAASIEAPRIEERGGRLSIETAVNEGPHARLHALSFAGTTAGESELREVAGLPAGIDYSEDAVLAGLRRVRDHYLGLGYPEARVTPQAAPAGNDIAVTFRVDEGDRVTITGIEVTGARRTRDSLLRRRTDLQVGAPLDLRALGLAEGRLLAIGTLTGARVQTDADDPTRVRVDVRERAPFALDYRVRYDDGKGTSFETDGELRHLFGLGMVLGGRYRLGSDERDARGFLNVPLGPGPLTLSASRLSEDLPDFFGNLTNARVQRELRVQQAVERWRPWVLLGGYRFKRVTATVSPIPVDIAAVSLSLARETRDNPLDARAGRFYGFDVELSPPWLGSDLRFVKSTAQAFFARTRGPFTWAQGCRLGFGMNFDGTRLRPTERFRAGGANTLRGFATDTLGPFDDILEEPAGGDAVLVLNQELRYRHSSGLGLTAFYDGGNVYERASDLFGLDLRHALGVGLRWDSPVGLLRADLGFPLARRANEKRWQLFFTFGQAF